MMRNTTAPTTIAIILIRAGLNETLLPGVVLASETGLDVDCSTEELKKIVM